MVCGHTHHQFDRAVLGKRLLNAGSVGMPYEDEPAAYWLLLEDGEPRLRRTAYDIAAAAERLRASGFPDVEELMLRESLLEPVGSAFIARHFEDARYALGRSTLSGRPAPTASTREVHVAACFASA